MGGEEHPPLPPPSAAPLNEPVGSPQGGVK